MGKLVLCWVAVVLLLGAPGRAAEPKAKADRDLPEAETFLLLAGEQMEAFHKEYRAYARDWYRLGFDYAYPTYRITDADVWPRPADKNRWKPRGSSYTYVIEEATADAYLIRALGADGKPAYEMRQGDKEPKRVE